MLQIIIDRDRYRESCLPDPADQGIVLSIVLHQIYRYYVRMAFRQFTDNRPAAVPGSVIHKNNFMI